jgi:hypothetical protein
VGESAVEVIRRLLAGAAVTVARTVAWALNLPPEDYSGDEECVNWPLPDGRAWCATHGSRWVDDGDRCDEAIERGLT